MRTTSRDPFSLPLELACHLRLGTLRHRRRYESPRLSSENDAAVMLSKYRRSCRRGSWKATSCTIIARGAITERIASSVLSDSIKYESSAKGDLSAKL